MRPVTIYTTPFCGYCLAAKRLLGAKDVAFEEVDVSAPERRAEMVQRAMGRRTVPQIFVGDVHLGGFSEIAGLEREGRLGRLLGGE
ncbi:MAG TPA: glutaredoxin 3 [Amaricoccus sp.]|jgi:glutaredoxin 3|nr:glutaredoxin 3 [Amaricoccus sp.]